MSIAAAIDTLRQADDYAALIAASNRLGSDPLQVQGPGGNTSLKDGEAMWIKASGTWLAHARDRDIMVPCNTGVLRRALEAEVPEPPEMEAFVVGDANPLGLRPSIETAVHAALDWPVVLHTHCVATIALAICRDGRERIAAALPNERVAFVPYVKPGWDLALAIRKAADRETRIVVLGNHGLVVSGPTVAEAEGLLRKVSAALQPASVRGSMAAAPALEDRLRGTGWIAAPDPITHALALDPMRLEMAVGATLYPDHLIFLGPGCRQVTDDALPKDTGGATCKLLLFPGLGAAIPADATASDLALARCLGDVLARVPDEAELMRLSPEEEAALLDWDAEKYRQSLNRAAP
ncbi:MAG: class II aldolase/adducin family protein [Pseudomonadota bacterium]